MGEVPTENGLEKSSAETLNLDDVMMHEVRVFGRFQLKLLIIMAIATIFTSWGGNAYIFTTTRVNTRCLIPECEDSGTNTEFLPGWLGAAVPGGDGNDYDNCQRYASATNNSTSTPLDICPTTLFDQSNVVDCEQFVYENTNTIVHEFNLGCDEWRRTIIGALRTVGALIGLPITGYMSDRWGRRLTLSIVIFLTAFMGTMRFFTNNYNGYLVTEIFEGFFGSGFGCAHILLIEVIGPKYGIITSAILNSFFSVGQITLALIAWGVPYWRNLVLAVYVPQFICVVMYWITPESPRWLKAKGRYEEFEVLLKSAAKTNRRQLSQKTLDALSSSANEERKQKEDVEILTEKEDLLILQVFRNKPILLRCVICPICWITLTLVYYGLSINSVGLAGNPYVNYMLVSVVEVPGFWLGMLFMFKFGRKGTLIVAYWLCAACQVAFIFIPDDLAWVSLMMFLIGKFAIAMVAIAVYVYTMEIFPTKNRNILFAYCSMIGRLGAIIAPLTPALGVVVFEQLPYILFAGFPFVSGILLLLLPETLGCSLPDTMEEAAMLGKKKKDTSKL